MTSSSSTKRVALRTSGRQVDHSRIYILQDDGGFRVSGGQCPRPRRAASERRGGLLETISPSLKRSANGGPRNRKRHD
ncbi:MAG: hypothetical protein RJA70_3094 [Pseudomonadota bacterium]|jgi:hypothetical protein